MSRSPREIRDPVHNFVSVSASESAVMDSAPFQRLRNIHQNSMTYLVYPGASHKRFEHSLGVMHLVGQMFDVVTAEDRLSDAVREIVPAKDELWYWRAALRIAALCHDLGHLPFSHASEGLLPKGVNHEALSRAFIESDLMQPIWETITPVVRAEHIVKLALGPKEAKGMSFSPWEEILADLITGDIFGADRIDYLLRDSHHIGVAYGRFDHHRLIRTLKILPPAATPPSAGAAEKGEVVDTDENSVFELGIERGGLESAEALQLARYFMFSQVYSHRVRLIYDVHLRDFVSAWLADEYGGLYPTDPSALLGLTDNEVMAELRIAATTESHPGHEPAWRIIEREHFKDFYGRRPSDINIFADAVNAIFRAAKGEFGEENVRYADGRKSGIPDTFSVEHDGDVVSSRTLSDTFENLPQPKDQFVYVTPGLHAQARRWEKEHSREILEAAKKPELESEDEEVAE